MRFSWYGAPSLTRGRVCSLQSLLGLASAVFLGSQSHGTHDHISTVSNLSLPKPGRPGSCIYFPQEEGSQVIPHRLGFVFILSVMFDVLMALNMTVTISWVLTLRHLVECWQFFGGYCCLNFLSKLVSQEGIICLHVTIKSKNSHWIYGLHISIFPGTLFQCIYTERPLLQNQFHIKVFWLILKLLLSWLHM
jgi:hypothetical protein